jgi:hypothetical protein
MASTSKRQQTMAKRNRELAVKEKRALKQAKKYAAAQIRKGEPIDPSLVPPGFSMPAPADEPEPTPAPAES